MMLDFNRANLSAAPLSVAINQLIECAEPPEPNIRQYLGASAIGSECLRKVQFDWMVDPVHPSQTRDVFRRGHLFETLTREHLKSAGFVFAPDEQLGFSVAGRPVPRPRRRDRHSRTGGPGLWGTRASGTLGDKGWKSLERDGIERAYPQYAAQIWLYQAYLGVDEHPAIFTAVNANTMQRLHLLHEFDAERAQAWSDRAVAVIEATRVGELLPRLTEDPGDWRCRICSHKARCWA